MAVAGVPVAAVGGAVAIGGLAVGAGGAVLMSNAGNNQAAGYHYGETQQETTTSEQTEQKTQNQAEKNNSGKEFNGKNETSSQTSKEAFGKAKDQNGIPRSQQPDKTIKVKETSKGVPTGKTLREHQYTNSQGQKVSIRRDNPTQYGQGGQGDQGPHYNAGSTGQKLSQHHTFFD